MSEYLDVNHHSLVERDWWPAQNFTPERLACSHCGEIKMHIPTLIRLQNVRDITGPLIVNSGYRCPEYNNAISSTGLNGPHTTGQAFDLKVSGDITHVILAAIQQGFTGIGLKQHGGYSGRFMHVDTLEPLPNRPRPHWWTYK